ncbi:hypothetical protein ACF0H5_020413 [Mactra antiquata]
MAAEDAHSSFEWLDGDRMLGNKTPESHYVPKSDRTSCQNKECGLIFGYPSLRRPHHCRRCGEIFCRPCLQYTRRLNVLAEPDPLGTPRKVCLNCYTERNETTGCTKRSHTELFHQLRQESSQERRDKVNDILLDTGLGTFQPKFWKDQFKVDILKECRRLLNGFERKVISSDVIMTLRNIKGQIKVPSWQKSTFWSLESEMATCRLCQGKVGPRKKIRNCRVCGISLCKLCSYKELLLYLEDGPRSIEGGPRSVECGPQSVKGGHQTEKSYDVKLSIIKVIGCPEKEPDVSVLLYCCYDCRTEIIQKQIEDEYWYKQISKPRDLQSEIVRMDDEFRQLTNKINMNIETYIALTEENESAKNEAIVKENNNTEDSIDDTEKRTTDEIMDECKQVKDKLGDCLNSYWTLFDELKTIYNNCEKPQGTHSHLARNYFKAKKDYYLETTSHIGKLSMYEVRWEITHKIMTS